MQSNILLQTLDSCRWMLLYQSPSNKLNELIKLLHLMPFFDTTWTLQWALLALGSEICSWLCPLKAGHWLLPMPDTQSGRAQWPAGHVARVFHSSLCASYLRRGIQIVKTAVSILSPRTKGTAVACIAHIVVSIFVSACEKRPACTWLKGSSETYRVRSLVVLRTPQVERSHATWNTVSFSRKCTGVCFKNTNVNTPFAIYYSACLHGQRVVQIHPCSLRIKTHVNLLHFKCRHVPHTIGRGHFHSDKGHVNQTGLV